MHVEITPEEAPLLYTILCQVRHDFQKHLDKHPSVFTDTQRAQLEEQSHTLQRIAERLEVALRVQHISQQGISNG